MSNPFPRNTTLTFFMVTIKDVWRVMCKGTFFWCGLMRHGMS